MQIGELSRVTGVSIPTIRVYEREGLIAPADRTDGRFRIFTETQRQRLDFIKRL
ncbi:MerR family transcriptional regulator [Sphingomonas sp. NPDC092331]|uniref:MerR family transcriptional regulator n=1 Tax=unclassified Sphingomonas TaxID=196159 RepID=UPI00380DB792